MDIIEPMAEPTTDLTVEPSQNEARGILTKTIVYYITFVALGLSIGTLGPTLPDLAANTRTQLNEISILFTVKSLGYLLGSLLGGRLYDHLRGHPWMSAGLFAMAVLLALTPQISVLALLAGVLLLLGMTEAVVDVGANILMVWSHRAKVGPFMNGLHFFFGLGAFIAPVVVAQAVLASGDIAWAYRGIALMMLPVAVVLLRLPSPQIPKAHQDEHGKPVRADRVILGLLMVGLFLFIGVETGFAGWIFTYAIRMGVGNEISAAYLTSLFWGSFTIGRLLGIPAAARIRLPAILTSSLLICGAGIGAIMLWPGEATAVWTGTILIGIGNASLFPMTLTLAERTLPINGRITGLFLVGGSLGGMSVPWVIGQIFEPVGPWSMAVVLMIDLVLALGVVIALSQYLRIKKGMTPSNA